jgi:hypothetical protein
MASPVVIILAPITLGVILLAIYLAFPRYGPHYTSKLTCSKCGNTFDYEWVPGGSFTALRLGTKRYMRCQVCKKWATFDIVSTIVYPDKKETSDDLNSSEGT